MRLLPFVALRAREVRVDGGRPTLRLPSRLGKPNVVLRYRTDRDLLHRFTPQPPFRAIDVQMSDHVGRPATSNGI